MNIIDTNLKWNSSLNYSNRPNKIVLHHAEASNCTVQDIHRWHLNFGWSGIGYHFFVRKDGSVYRGRPEKCIGAHVSGQNTNTLGICAEGSYMSETMPQAQKQAIKELIKYLDGKYGKLPIYGHREVGASNCPGTNYPLAELKNRESGPAPEPAIQWIVNLQKEINKAGNNIAVDGLPGPITLSKCPLLKQGMQGNFVRLLQEKIGTSIDGIFGPNTYKAVIAYQKSKGLIQDGIVGQNTWKKLLGI